MLAGLDSSVTSALSHGIAYYCRFVGDALVLHRQDISDEIALAMCSWHPSIAWEATAAGTASIAYLDLSLTVRGM